MTEETTPRPDNFYGISKLKAEELVKAYHKETKTPTLILRLSTLYGPGMHPKAAAVKLFRLTTKKFFIMIGDGENPYEFSYIKNVARGIIKAAQHNQELGLYNIADIDKMSFNELISLISQETNPKLKIIHIPYSLARIVGVIGDILATLSGKRIPFRTRTIKGMTGGWVTSTNKAQEEFNYIQTFSNEEGIKTTVAAFKKQGYL